MFASLTFFNYMGFYKRSCHGFLYITTNPKKTTLYIGITNNLERRLEEHFEGTLKPSNSFAPRYHCYNLIYFEILGSMKEAIAREKQLKRWSRAKKEALIATKNPKWDFLNNREELWDIEFVDS